MNSNINQVYVLFLINISLPWLSGIKHLSPITRLPQEGGFYALKVPFVCSKAEDVQLHSCYHSSLARVKLQSK